MSELKSRVAGAALCVGLIAGCSSPEVAESEPQTTELPSVLDEPEQNEAEAIEQGAGHLDCSVFYSAQSIGNFVLNVDAADAEEGGYTANDITDIAYFIKDYENLSPAELVDTYIADFEESSGRSLNFSFEEDILPEAWTEVDEEDELLAEMKLSQQKQVLLGRINNLMLAINEYPIELLSTLNVDTVRVANEYERYAGHYNSKDNEILVNHESFRGNAKDSLDSLRRLVAHEVAHAMHDIYCHGNMMNDTDISNLNRGYGYIGHPTSGDGSGSSEFSDHYRQVPPELYEYGEARMFPRAYGATNVAEDFATVVDFTLEIRGEIMPGDADYGSPLQQKQQLVIARLEGLLPGSESFIKERTELLRRTPIHEVVSSNVRIIEELPETPEMYDGNNEPITSYWDLKESGQETVTVLNGAIYNDHPVARGGNLTLYPLLVVNPEGRAEHLHYRTDQSSGSISFGANNQLEFFEGQLDGGDMLTISMDEYEKLSKVIDITSPEADAFFADNPSLVRQTTNKSES